MVFFRKIAKNSVLVPIRVIGQIAVIMSITDMPWTVSPVENREENGNTLERAHGAVTREVRSTGWSSRMG